MFGLGELALHGGGPVHEHFPLILQHLSSLLSHEECGRVIDQVVGALCRLMVANREIVPVKDVLPVVFRHLPLREDDEEYCIVFQCLGELYGAGEPLVRSGMPQVLQLAGNLHVKMNATGNREKAENWEQAEAAMSALLRAFCKDSQAEFASAVSQMPANVAEAVAKIVA